MNVVFTWQNACVFVSHDELFQSLIGHSLWLVSPRSWTEFHPCDWLWVSSHVESRMTWSLYVIWSMTAADHDYRIIFLCFHIWFMHWTLDSKAVFIIVILCSELYKEWQLCVSREYICEQATHLCGRYGTITLDQTPVLRRTDNLTLYNIQESTYVNKILLWVGL